MHIGTVGFGNVDIFRIVYLYLYNFYSFPIGTTAAAVAIVACIVGILCMPLILILVYKQRKAMTARSKYHPLSDLKFQYRSHCYLIEEI